MWPKATFGICKKVLQSELTVCVRACVCVCVCVCVCIKGEHLMGASLGVAKKMAVCVGAYVRVCVMGGGGDIVNVCAML